jgi:hypothetical protein
LNGGGRSLIMFNRTLEAGPTRRPVSDTYTTNFCGKSDTQLSAQSRLPKKSLPWGFEVGSRSFPLAWTSPFPFRMPAEDVEENRLLFVGRQVTCKRGSTSSSPRWLASLTSFPIRFSWSWSTAQRLPRRRTRSLVLAGHVPESRGAQPQQRSRSRIARRPRSYPAARVRRGRRKATGRPEGSLCFGRAGHRDELRWSAGSYPSDPTSVARPEGDAAALAQTIVEFLDSRIRGETEQSWRANGRKSNSTLANCQASRKPLRRR